MNKDNLLAKLLKEAEETIAKAEEEKLEPEVKPEELADKAAEERAEDIVDTGADIAADKPDELKADVVKEDLAEEGEIPTDKKEDAEEVSPETIATKAAEIIDDKTVASASDIKKEDVIVPDTHTPADGTLAGQENVKPEEPEDAKSTDVAQATPSTVVSADANPAPTVIESTDNVVETKPEQKLEPEVKHADSELETTDTQELSDKEVKPEELADKAAEEIKDDNVASASDVASDKPDELTKEQGEGRDTEKEFEESFNSLINFLREENENLVETKPEQKLEPEVKHADSELETTDTQELPSKEAKPEELADKAAEERAADTVDSSVDVAADKPDELKTDVVKEDLADKMEIAKAENDGSEKKEEQCPVELADKAAEEIKDGNVASAADVKCDEPDELKADVVKEENENVVETKPEQKLEPEVKHADSELKTTDTQELADNEVKPEELADKAAEERAEDTVEAGADIERDEPDMLPPGAVDVDYKSLKEAAGLGKNYFENPDHKAKLIDECVLLSAKEANDLIYEEYKATISKANMLKEALSSKYGKLAARRADLFTRGLTEDFHYTPKLFNKLNEQIVINMIDRKIKLMEDSDVVFGKDDDIYFEHIASLDPDDIASEYASACVVTEGSGFKAKFLKFLVRFLPEKKLKNTLNKIYTGAKQQAKGDEKALARIEKYNPEGKSKDEMRLLFKQIIDLCGTDVSALEEKSKKAIDDANKKKAKQGNDVNAPQDNAANDDNKEKPIKEELGTTAILGLTALYAWIAFGVLCGGTLITIAIKAISNAE